MTVPVRPFESNYYLLIVFLLATDFWLCQEPQKFSNSGYDTRRRRATHTVDSLGFFRKFFGPSKLRLSHLPTDWRGLRVKLRVGHAPIFADAHRCASDAHRCAWTASLIKKEIALAHVVILRCVWPQRDLRFPNYKCLKTNISSCYILMPTKFNCTLGHAQNLEQIPKKIT